MTKSDNSVGIVKTQYFSFSHPPYELKLESGQLLGPITIAYETYGTLNQNKTNALLIIHALSGDAHVAGYHSPNDKKSGWWDIMVGPGKPLDTNKYFIICSNIIGGCKGTTGPSSINPHTNKPYGLDFPVVTITDMVKVQKILLDHLGIEKIITVIGGSMGGMQVLDWTLQFPDIPLSAIIIASCASLSSQAIAFDAVGRNAITKDFNWKGGDYYSSNPMLAGLAVARMLGHITYLSEHGMRQKFGRKLQNSKAYTYQFKDEFEVENYLAYQGLRFLERFDANSYLYITKAMDYFDVSSKYGAGSLEHAFKGVKAKMFLISITSDWLFPSHQSLEIVHALRLNNKDVSYLEIESTYGHDAFLLENQSFSTAIRNFLCHIKS